MADFTLKRNDWGDIAPLRVRLKVLDVDPETGEAKTDGEGNKVYIPFDLSNTEVLHLYLRGTGLGEEGKDLLIKAGPMTMENKPGGVASYAFEKAEGEDPADTAVKGTYRMEFEATQKSGGGLLTFPSGDEEDRQYLTLEIVEDLGP